MKETADQQQAVLEEEYKHWQTYQEQVSHTDTTQSSVGSDFIGHLQRQRTEDMQRI